MTIHPGESSQEQSSCLSLTVVPGIGLVPIMCHARPEHRGRELTLQGGLYWALHGQEAP